MTKETLLCACLDNECCQDLAPGFRCRKQALTSNLASRLREHAQVHEDLIRDASDEQAQWALDLRQAADLLDRIADETKEQHPRGLAEGANTAGRQHPSKMHDAGSNPAGDAISQECLQGGPACPSCGAWPGESHTKDKCLTVEQTEIRPGRRREGDGAEVVCFDQEPKDGPDVNDMFRAGVTQAKYRRHYYEALLRILNSDRMQSHDIALAAVDSSPEHSPVETSARPTQDALKAPVTSAEMCPTWDNVQHEEHQGKCIYCGAPMPSPVKASGDPYRPVCEGGTGGPCTSPDCEKCWPDDPVQTEPPEWR